LADGEIAYPKIEIEMLHYQQKRRVFLD